MKSFWSVGALGWVLFLGSCVHEPFAGTGVQPDPPVRVCDPDTVYFNQELLPLFRGQCGSAGCHDAATASDGVRMDTYANIVNTADVNPFDPNGSKLYQVLLDTDPDKRMPRPPASAWDPDLIERVRLWILQGAGETDCAGCDSSDVSYSVDLEPLFASACRSCHSGASAPKGVQIQNYADVSALVSDGRLLGVLNGTGYATMPPGGLLDDCRLNQIESWILQGAPNN